MLFFGLLRFEDSKAYHDLFIFALPGGYLIALVLVPLVQFA